MNEIVKKMMTHNFCINNIEKSNDDNSVLKFKAVVMDFKKSHNGWAVSRDTAEKHMQSLVHKHIVAKYYNENENGGMDSFGSHEPSEVALRGTNGEIMIPSTNTRSIGTITNVYIAPLIEGNALSEEVLWCDGILLAWDNINECSLLLEWAENNIPILTSVEWFYTQNMIDNDGVEWIVDPTFNALTILNSEQRGNKNIIYGNYDCSHIELMLNNDHYKQFNEAIVKDINIETNREGEMKLENMFLKALNDISFGEVRSKIYEALAKVMVAEEYNSMYIGMWDIYENYFIYETYNGEKWVRYRIDYTKSESDEITVNFDSKKQVERQDVYVEVSESQKAVNEVLTKLSNVEIKLNESEGLLLGANGQLETANNTIEVLKLENAELQLSKEELNKIKFNEKLEEAKTKYQSEFLAFNSEEKFNSEDVQNLIMDTLDTDKSLNASLQIKDILLECAKNNKPAQEQNPLTPQGLIETSKGLNGLLPKVSNFKEKYGLDI